MPSQHVEINTRDAANQLRKPVWVRGAWRAAELGAQKAPLLRVKVDVDGRNELLEGPSASEPSTRPQSLEDGWFVDCLDQVLVATSQKRVIVRSQLVDDIAEKRITNCGISIPAKHAVDGLGKLSTRRFVDAAGVDPDILITLRFR
jgi:hypothetical protein